MEQLNQTTQRPFNLFYFLAGKERDDNLRNTIRDHRFIISTGVISILMSLSTAIIIGINIDKYIEYQNVTVVFGLITFFFILFFNRTVFIYSDPKSKSKAIVISLYVLVYIFLSIIQSRVFLFYFLDKELATIKSDTSSLALAEGLIKVLKNLNTDQRRSVQNLRFFISSVLFLWSLLPMINHLLFTKNQDNKIDAQTQLLIQSLQAKLLEKKYEFANLNSVSSDPSDPFSESSTSEALELKREQLLSEIVHLQRSIDIL